MSLLSPFVHTPSAAPPMRFWPYFLPGLVVAAVVFTAFPRLDLQVSALFYDDAARVWPLMQGAQWARGALNTVAWAVLAAAIGISLYAVLRPMIRTKGRPPWSTAVHAVAFVGLCYALGPGVIVNLGFKNHWGRARPNTVEEFGGKRSYTPALRPTNQCGTNCSFVSGEGSLGFIAAAPAAILEGGARAGMLGLGGFVGAALGGVRIIQGAHFLSDVVFSGFASWFAAWLSYGLVYRQWLQELWRRRRRTPAAGVSKAS